MPAIERMLTYETVDLPRWGTQVTVAHLGDGRTYFPLRVLCAVLGIAPQMQVRRCQEHEVLKRLLVQLPMPTSRGAREAWCLHQRGIGFWLGSIQIASVRAEIRPHLLEFQEALVDAAHALLMRPATTPEALAAHLATTDSQLAGVQSFTLALEERIGRLEQRVLVPEEDEE